MASIYFYWVFLCSQTGYLVTGLLGYWVTWLLGYLVTGLLGYLVSSFCLVVTLYSADETFLGIHCVRVDVDNHLYLPPHGREVGCWFPVFTVRHRLGFVDFRIHSVPAPALEGVLVGEEETPTSQDCSLWTCRSGLVYESAAPCLPGSTEHRLCVRAYIEYPVCVPTTLYIWLLHSSMGALRCCV